MPLFGPLLDFTAYNPTHASNHQRRALNGTINLELLTACTNFAVTLRPSQAPSEQAVPSSIRGPDLDTKGALCLWGASS